MCFMKNGFVAALAILSLLAGRAAARAGDTEVIRIEGSGPAPEASKPAAPAAEAPRAAALPSKVSLGPPSAEGCCPALTCCAGCAEPAPGGGGLWASADLLLWRIKNSHVPLLVSQGPPGSGGILGLGAVTVFGGSVDNEDRIGGRFTLGTWLDDCGTVGLEGGYLFLGSRSVPFSAGSNGGPGTAVIGRPFFDVSRGAPNSQLVASPGLLAGTVGVNLSSRLQGAELNGVYNLCCGCCGRLELLGGLRYLQLNEGLGVGENLQVLPGVPGIGGNAFITDDQFDTANHFYGGQLGARAEVRRGKLFLTATAKVALGDNHETVVINGSSTITPAGRLPVTLPGGLLALPTNIGHYNHDSFAVVPEAGLTIGYQLGEHLRVYAGYTFLYWSDVARPGEQIDVGVNAARLPVVPPFVGPVGAARPAFTFRETDFWAQGVHVGLEYRF